MDADHQGYERGRQHEDQQQNRILRTPCRHSRNM
jgi:hypothetical protein